MPPDVTRSREISFGTTFKVGHVIGREVSRWRKVTPWRSCTTKRCPLGLELVAEVGVEHLDGDVVSGPHFG
jgi:hypothetical protein